MAVKFMRVRKIVLSILTVAIIASQLTGCAAVNKSELLEMIEDGETVTIELSVPNWSEASAKQLEDLSWVELAQLKTYTTTGFRAAVDMLFNINTVTTQIGDTKQGCMYTISEGGKDIQSGNTTLRDAFRNKAFNNYWNKESVQNGLAEATELAYTDIDHTSQYSIMAALNAYFNLFNDGDNDTTYGPTQSLTREQFYTMVYKASNGVQELNYSGKSDAFSILTGTDNYYTQYAKQVADKGFLSMENGSLNGTNIGTPISKLEAIYMMVNTYFNKELTEIQLNGKETAFGYRNAGDQISKIKANGEEASLAVENNLLAYLIDTQGEKGIDQTIMPYLMVAERLGLMNGISANGSLFTSITKDETLRLLTNTFSAENSLYGYLTTEEYGEMETVEGQGVIVETEDQTPVDYTDTYQKIYDSCYSGVISDEDNFEIEKVLAGSYVEDGILPLNGVDLYSEWRLSNHPLNQSEATNNKTPEQSSGVTYELVNETVYTTGSANIRSGASTNDSIIKTVSKGTSMTRTAIGSNGWSKVEFNGAEAYISSDLLTTTKPAPAPSHSSSGSSGSGSSSSGGSGSSGGSSSGQTHNNTSGGQSQGGFTESGAPIIPGAEIIDNTNTSGMTEEEALESIRNGSTDGFGGTVIGG